MTQTGSAYRAAKLYKEVLVTKDELIALLGNCVLACALTSDPDILRDVHEAADKHVKELDKRFPGWREELQQ